MALFQTRTLVPTYYTRVGPDALFASDGAPLYDYPARGVLITWPQPGMYLPMPWVMTERPQLTSKGFQTAANAPSA